MNYPSVINWIISFQLTVPNVKIYGDRDIFVKSSSTVQLRCVVSQSLVPPTYIEWRHNDEHLPLATSALRYVDMYFVIFNFTRFHLKFVNNIGGFHLYLSELAFINQFYSIMTRLVRLSLAND